MTEFVKPDDQRLDGAARQGATARQTMPHFDRQGSATASTHARRDAADVGATPRFPPVAATRIQRSRAPVIRRAIDNDTWRRRIQPAVVQKRPVTVRHNGVDKLLYGQGRKLFLQESGQEPVELTRDTLAAFRANADYLADDLPTHLIDAPTFEASVTSGSGFKVTEFAGQPMSLVHHTANDDGSGAHLTIENAHVLGLYDVTSPLGDVSSKVGQDKATINKRLLDEYQIPAVDNLNFFAPPDPRPKKGNKKSTKKNQLDDESETAAEVHRTLSLSQYLTFMVHAFDQSGIRAEYGQRMMAMATRMSADKHLDLANLFLRVGMDESSFIRAVLAIDSRLRAAQPGSAGLPIGAAAREPFEKWWTVKGNVEPVAYLPELSPLGEPELAPGEQSLAGRPLLREGTSMANGTTFPTVEKAYTTRYFPDFVAAVNTWTATQPAVF